MGFFTTDVNDTPTEILVSGHGSDSRLSITIRSGAGVLSKGTVLGRVNTGTSSGLYDKYSDADVSTLGLGVARGVLADKADASSSGVQTSMYTHGTFYKEKMIGLDANGETDLKNCVFVQQN